MGVYGGPAPLTEPVQYTASNGYHIEQAPVTLSSIHRAIDNAAIDSDEYWALIEYLAWFKERLEVPPNAVSKMWY